MWKLRWNSNFPHKNVNRFETIFVLGVYDGGGPVLYLAGWAELGSVFGVDLWDRCVSGRGHHFFCSSVEIVETFFVSEGPKCSLGKWSGLWERNDCARGEWADKTSRRFRRLNLSLFSIFWKLITSFVICREFF